VFSVLTEHDDVGAFFVLEHDVRESARFVCGLARDARIAASFLDCGQNGGRLLVLDLLKLRQQGGIRLCADRARQIGHPRTLQHADVDNVQRAEPRAEFLREPNRVVARDISGG
jgi:hypothetical protein